MRMLRLFPASIPFSLASGLILVLTLKMFALAEHPTEIEEQSPATEAYITASFPQDQWLFFSGRKDAKIADTWKVAVDEESKLPILVCRGEPHGYLRTQKSFTNFDLSLDWRFPTDPNGNSGILLFTSGDDRIWPASLQVQLHQPEVGSTFPVGGAKSGNEIRIKKDLAKPLNQWNHCEIQCRNGTVAVSINGQKVGEVTGCMPAEGTIALQSEGSEIHFRSIVIREVTVTQSAHLNPEKTASDEASPVSEIQKTP